MEEVRNASKNTNNKIMVGLVDDWTQINEVIFGVYVA